MRIMFTTTLNRSNSAASALISGFSSTNGMIRSDRLSRRRTPKRPDILSMTVVPRIAYDVAAAEELLHSVKNTYALLSLNNRECRSDLPTQTTRSIPEDRSTETAFAVDEADDPLRKAWPFLLIVRTGRIFTIRSKQPTRRLYQPISSAGFSGFPAYSQLHFQNYS